MKKSLKKSIFVLLFAFGITIEIVTCHTTNFDTIIQIFKLLSKFVQITENEGVTFWQTINA